MQSAERARRLVFCVAGSQLHARRNFKSALFLPNTRIASCLPACLPSLPSACMCLCASCYSNSRASWHRKAASALAESDAASLAIAARSFRMWVSIDRAAARP